MEITASGVFTSCATPAASRPSEVSFSVCSSCSSSAHALRDVVQQDQPANALAGLAHQRRHGHVHHQVAPGAVPQMEFVKAGDALVVRVRGDFRRQIGGQNFLELDG